MSPRPPLPPFKGLIRRREASIDDVPIDERERRIFGPRPKDERGQSFPSR